LYIFSEQKVNNGKHMKENEIIVGLDIGTTKICAIVGKRNAYNKIDILGMGRVESHNAMKRGELININRTVDAIKQSVQMASSASNVNIASVFVGIAGQHIRSLHHRGQIMRSNRDDEMINKGDIRRLIEDMYRVTMPPGEEILHVIPMDYIVDNNRGIKEPIGMSGVRLEGNFHIISGKVDAARNIKKCVSMAGLEVEGVILEPIASSEAVITEDEKEAGVALVDIGGGTTDLAIFYDGIIRHTSVIPLGGNIITNDIKSGCYVMEKQAELMKIKFGSALSNEAKDNEIISIPGLKDRDPKEISVKNLASIIQARMEEIFEHIFFEIKSSGYLKQLQGGLVITGGGSQLKHLKQLAEYKSGLDARIGYPTEYLAKGMIEEVKSPMYATSVGLILAGFNEKEFHQEKKVEKSKDEKNNLFGGIFRKAKSWLEDDQDDFLK
jgi:cell division protein FtsA